MYLQSGDADAALLSRAQVSDAAVLTVDIDGELYDPLIQAMAVVTASRRREAAGAFAQFVMGTEGQQILRESGFENPPPPVTPSGTPAETIKSP